MTRIPLDVHAHLAPVIPERIATLPGVSWQREPARLTVDGHPLGISDLYKPERLLQWMDQHGVERALISAPPPLYRQQLSEEQAESWAIYLNDGLLSISEQHPSRLKTLLHLPLEHPKLAVKLLKLYMGSTWAGAALAAGGGPNIVFSNLELMPLWEMMNQEGTFVFVHPGSCGDGRLATHYLENLIGNPIETGVAAAHLVMAGIPQRFPNVRFCLAHAGGTFTGLVGRMERGFQTRRPGVDIEVERPLQAARRFYVDCIAHHPGLLRLAQDVYGNDHVVFGSDWPFPMGLPDGAPDGWEPAGE